MPRTNTEIILSALLEGITVEKAGQEFKLNETNQLCGKFTKTHKGKSHGTAWLPMNLGDITLPAFINWCAHFTPDEMTAVTANLALNQIKADEAKRRDGMPIARAPRGNGD